MNSGREQYIEQCKQENQKVLSTRHLLKYERDKNGQPVGVVIAFKDENEIVKLGWSKCNVKEEQFNKNIGINKAISRARDYREVDERDAPYKTQKEISDMIERLGRYFCESAILKFNKV
jgi:hypothetical protein